MNLSDRALRALAIHGLDAPTGRGPAWAERRRRARAAATELDDVLDAGQVALVTGPSGSGKSLILGSLARRLRAAGRPVLVADAALVGPCARRRPLIDLVSGTVESALAALARAGLGDARVLAIPFHALSDGQRARALLAIAFSRASGPCTLVADEFASTLDRTSAAALARTAARWARASGARAVLATAHDDVLEPLGPDVLVEQPLDGAARMLVRRLAA